MDIRKRDKAVQGCNWLMVVIAAGWVAYTFAGTFSSPADSQVSLPPPAVVQQAPLPTEEPPVPIRRAETPTAQPSNQTAAPRQNRAPRSISRPDPRADWVVAPEVGIPSMQTFPPGVGPDF